MGGGGVIWADKLFYASVPFRMIRKNSTIRGLGGSGASRKETGAQPDNYAWFCGIVSPSWQGVIASWERAGTTVTLTFTLPHGLQAGDVIVLDGYGRGNANTGYTNRDGVVIASNRDSATQTQRRTYDALFAAVIEVIDPAPGGVNTKITFEAPSGNLNFGPVNINARADKPGIVVEEDGCTIENIALISDRISAITTKTQLLDYQANFAGIGIVGRTATTDITLKDVVFIGVRRAVDLNNSPGVRIWSLYGDVENGIRLTNCADSCEARGVRLFSWVSQTGIIRTEPIKINAVVEDTATGCVKLELDGPHMLGERVAVSGVNFLPANNVLYRFTVKSAGANALVLTDVGFATGSGFTPALDGAGSVLVGGGDSCALKPIAGTTTPFFQSGTKLGVRLASVTPLTGVNINHLVNVQVQGSTTLGGFARVLQTTTTPQPIGDTFTVDLPWNPAYANSNEPRVVAVTSGGGEARIAGTAGASGTAAGFFNSGGKLGLRLQNGLSTAVTGQLLDLIIPGDPTLGGRLMFRQQPFKLK